MERSVFQLVYISTATEAVTRNGLEQILHRSQRRNSGCGVTGLLVAGPRRFLQALEGPEAAVLETYERIKADPRHHALVMLTGRAIDARAFGSWSMAYEQADQLGHQTDLFETVDAMTASLRDKSLRAHFVGFAEIHKRAA